MKVFDCPSQSLDLDTIEIFRLSQSCSEILIVLGVKDFTASYYFFYTGLGWFIWFISPLKIKIIKNDFLTLSLCNIKIYLTI